MNRKRRIWIAVALLSIGSLGVCATTIQSTMATDANDVIDLDYDRVPIGQDDASSALDEIEAGGDEARGESTKRTGGDGEAAGRTSGAAGSDVERQRSADSADATARSGARDGSGGLQAQVERHQHRLAEAATGEDAGVPSLLDRLRSLLAALLPLLAVAALVLAVAGLAYRYRGRLLALLGRSADSSTAGSGARGADDPIGRPPENDVDRAWAAMVRRLDVDRPATTTPDEFAEAAVAAGLDPEAVHRLTEAFESVRYGGRPVTDRHERIARRSRRRFHRGDDR